VEIFFAAGVEFKALRSESLGSFWNTAIFFRILSPLGGGRFAGAGGGSQANGHNLFLLTRG
jgi:hypothetical protein